MLLPARRTYTLILAIFVLLILVACTRQLDPGRWSFRGLRPLSTHNNPSETVAQPVETPLSNSDIPVIQPVSGDVVDAGESSVVPPPPPAQPTEPAQSIEPPAEKVSEAPTEPQEPPKKPPIDLNKYLTSIRDINDTSLDRLKCPPADRERYDYLRTLHNLPATPPPFKPYFFALNLHECIHILPRLLGSIVEAIRILGPENCALSIVEGRSDDGTFEVLTALNQSLPEGVDYYFSRSEINPTKSGRIGSLAELRNLAIQPLTDHPERFSSTNTTVIFFNDVAACPDDILELVHQKVFQKADMTCAMDWNYVDYSGSFRLTFYDVWIARTMSGESFFHIPFGGSWNESMRLFFGQNDADRLSKARFEKGLPFQVFACWNGGVVFDAKPIMDEGVRFRLNRDNECYQGEVSLFTKDLWIKGHGNIAVVPSVNLAYDDKTAVRIQKEKGLPGDWNRKNARNKSIHVPWKTMPPPKVLCIPDWVRQPQTWVDWNE
ncbi:hypothetical protein BT63DRAFT_435306 [Microthyrium microscopicum]|uniref:Alpha-1,3-mannosyltransferase CMT1 n=1 Tax=Microthyrium microscopicum TaxID=703497 RepID=A0A6A6URV9_9PEZI|nr:hypothetical protein BT63DRAFT_435306 [Microthyrium microscopicum]